MTLSSISKAQLFSIWMYMYGMALCQQEAIPDQLTYRAAVYEYIPLVVGTSWETIEHTLNIYEDQIRTAAQLGAKIIVFPEDGIFGMGLNRTEIYPFLEDVPNPQESLVNPCIDTVPMSRNTIQRRLSCAARWYQMYVVANFGSVLFCGKDSGPCPKDGRFQYNTNVVFDSDGTIVARYHKQNLYFENQFNVPPKVEYTVFDSPFGSFGTFTCFDMLFKEPVLTLIESVGVVNIAFTTAWGNVMPEMFSIGVQESFAVRMGVNLLAANVHIPMAKMQGSGIYSSNEGALVYYNNDNWLSDSKLIIANVTTTPKGPPLGNVSMPTSSKGFAPKQNFTALMESNRFIFTTLDTNKMSDTLFMEYKQTKCYLNYTLIEKGKNDLYGFGIFDGLHKSDLNSYIQVCALVKCVNTSKYSCGQATRESSTIFQNIELSGQFSTHYIFPSLLVEGANLSKKDWNFLLDKRSHRGQIQSTNLREMKPLISSILYTRSYEKDNNVPPEIYDNGFVEEKIHFKWNIKSIGNIQMDKGVVASRHIYLIVLGVGILACSLIVSGTIYYRNSTRKDGYIRL